MSYSVLVVDDSPIIRTMVTKALSMCGVDIGELHHAGTGREALDVLGEHWVDVVFADINMPEMTGEEMVLEMAEDEMLQDIPVVIVSSVRDEGRIEELRRKGVRAYIRKPFRPEYFKQILTELGLT